jgi:hypothetical protein
MEAVERFVTSASAETVWRILADVEHWRDWNPAILEVKPLTDDGLRVGARYQVTQPGLRPGVYEVIGCVPKESFTWIQKLLGGDLIADHRVAIRGSMTEVELSFSSRGLWAAMAIMPFSQKIRQSVSAEARSLKERSEAVARS